MQHFLMRKRMSRGSPYQRAIGISRAVLAGPFVCVAGTAPLGPDGRTERNSPIRLCRHAHSLSFRISQEARGRTVSSRTSLRILIFDGVESARGFFSRRFYFARELGCYKVMLLTRSPDRMYRPTLNRGYTPW